jgi:hypothetical protein
MVKYVLNEHGYWHCCKLQPAKIYPKKASQLLMQFNCCLLLLYRRGRTRQTTIELHCLETACWKSTGYRVPENAYWRQLAVKKWIVPKCFHRRGVEGSWVIPPVPYQLKLFLGRESICTQEPNWIFAGIVYWAMDRSISNKDFTTPSDLY